MATPKTDAKKQGESETKNTDSFVCPECGREFTRAAALGAHRKQAHGVAGSSKAAAANRGGRRRQRRSQTTSSARASAGRTATRTARNGAGGVDRDRLLSVLFPNGIPARSDTLGSINAWLDEAERLAARR